VSRRIGQLD